MNINLHLTSVCGEMSYGDRWDISAFCPSVYQLIGRSACRKCGIPRECVTGTEALGHEKQQEQKEQSLGLKPDQTKDIFPLASGQA